MSGTPSHGYCCPVCVYYCNFIHSLLHGYLAVIKKTVMATFYLGTCFSCLLGKMPRSGIDGSWLRFVLLAKKPFPKGLPHLGPPHCSLAMPESSCISARQTCKSLVSLFNCSYSSKSEEVSHYAFTCILLMTNNAAYLSCIGHLCILFCEMLVHIFIDLLWYIC